MSHKVKLKTELTNSDRIKAQLTNLGLTYKEAKEGETLTTNGRYGVKTQVDIRVDGNGQTTFHGAVGFKKQEDGTYTVEGDFDGLYLANGERLTAQRLKGDVTAFSKVDEASERFAHMGFMPQAEVRSDKDYVYQTLTREV